MTVCRPISSIVISLAAGQRMSRRHEQHELVGAEQQRRQLALGRIERQHAEVHRAQQHFLRHLPRRHAPDLHEDAGMLALERVDERQHRVHAALVRADEHAALLDVAQVGDGPGGLVGQPQQPVGVVEQQLAGVGQRAVAGRPVDQPLARAPARAAGWPG